MGATLTQIERVRYGIAFGAFVGAVCLVVDAVAVGVWGSRIPMTLPVILAGVYVVGGGCAGAVFGAVQGMVECGWEAARAEARGSHSEARHRKDDFRDWENRREGTSLRGMVRGQIRRACWFACLAGFGVGFVERVRLGYEAYMDGQLGYVPVAAGLTAGVLSIVALGRRPAAGCWSEPAVWQIACASLFCALWQPFSNLYQAPVLSLTSLLANAGYLSAAVFVWLGFSRLATRLIGCVQLECSRGCLGGAAATLAMGLTLSCGVLWLRAGRPIDLPHAVAEEGLRPDGFHQEANRPDVVLIVLDTVRADHLSVYGYAVDTTPNLARFADGAVRYQQAIAPSSWTLPSHASMFTGLLPTEHRAHNVRLHGRWNIHPLEEGFETLAEVLSAYGYYCGGVVANTGCLSREFGVHQGFHYYDDHSGPSLAAAKPKTISPSLWICHMYQCFVDSWRMDWSRSAEEINRDVVRWLNHTVAAPRFLFVNYLDAHAPYHRHPELALTRRQGPSVAGGIRLAAERAEDAWRYDQEIAYLDAQLGALFDELRSRRLYDNALIIVTSDHGEAFGEHDNVGHGQTVYQEEIRVPLLVKYPASVTGTVETEPICLTALPCMILNHLGIESPACADVAPVANAGGIMAELRQPTDSSAAIGGPAVVRALFDEEGYKVIVRDGGTAELYDLIEDPFELHDLAGDRAEPVRRALQHVDDWTALVESRRKVADNAFTMSKGLRDKLRSLGYVE